MNMSKINTYNTYLNCKIKNIVLLCVFSCVAILSYAQPPHGMEPTPEQIEKMRAHKVAFITTELNLTSAEAEKFWPIYNEMDNKQHEMREANRKNRAGKKIDEMNDAELEKLVDQHLAFRQQELDLEKEYTLKFKTVLPIKKVAKLHHAEQSFHRELIKKLQEKDSKGSKPNEPKGIMR